MKIGIDIDEVVAEFVDGFLEFYNQKAGTSLDREDIKSYSFHENLEISEEEVEGIVDEFCNSEKLVDLGIVEGSKQGVINLDKYHDVVFITSRSSDFEKGTEKFLKKNFPEHDFEIYFSKKDVKSKAEICSELGIDLILEDNPHYALDCAEKGTRVFLFNQPWNQDCEHENIIRVRNWTEVLEELE